MIIVADSGSTKTDWRIAQEGNVISTSTKGLNPYFMSPKEMIDELSQSKELQAIVVSDNLIEAIYFYGAGLSTNDKILEMQNTLKSFFKKAKKVEVASDMLGAARAVLGKNRGVACILGTGSNSCLYNGEKITQNIPALGYVLGDEGSGTDLGKRFLQAYFYNELPQVVKENFKRYIKLSDDEIIEHIYKKTLPNRFLASVSPFIKQNIMVRQVKEIVDAAFSAFIQKHILPYHSEEKNIGFCGSVAYFFKDELNENLKKYDLRMGTVTNQPVNQLVEYHRNNANL